MKRSFLILTAVAVACVTVAYMSSTNVPTVKAQQAAATGGSNQTARMLFEYGTLTTRQNVEDTNRIRYDVTWNEGDLLVTVSSTRSLEDAHRKLIGRLAGQRTRFTLLSNVLNHFGSQGWRLIETEKQDESSSITRVFVRTR